MNIKLIVSAIAAVGVLMLFGVRPSSLLDQGGKVWEKFSGDLSAVFSGKANDRLAREVRGNFGNNVQAIYDAAPAAAGDETSAIARDIGRDRRETARTAKVVDINTRELKQRVEDQKGQLE